MYVSEVFGRFLWVLETILFVGGYAGGQIGRRNVAFC